MPQRTIAVTATTAIAVAATADTALQPSPPPAQLLPPPSPYRRRRSSTATTTTTPPRGRPALRISDATVGRASSVARARALYPVRPLAIPRWLCCVHSPGLSDSGGG